MIIQGKAYWAKIVGEAQPGYDKSQKEWSMDLSLDSDAVKKVKEMGLGHKIKNKGDDRGDFIQFKRKAMKRDPSTGASVPAKPIRIVGPTKEDWGTKTLIGNGSTVNVNFVVNEVTYQGKTHTKPGIIAVQVVELVEYEGGDREEFPEYNEDGTETWAETE